MKLYVKLFKSIEISKLNTNTIKSESYYMPLYITNTDTDIYYSIYKKIPIPSSITVDIEKRKIYTYRDIYIKTLDDTYCKVENIYDVIKLDIS